MNDKPTCNLEVDTSTGEYPNSEVCDGCGRVIEAGEKYITNIESCCGGCVRSICMTVCAAHVAKLLKLTLH